MYNIMCIHGPVCRVQIMAFSMCLHRTLRNVIHTKLQPFLFHSCLCLSSSIRFVELMTHFGHMDTALLSPHGPRGTHIHSSAMVITENVYIRLKIKGGRGLSLDGPVALLLNYLGPGNGRVYESEIVVVSLPEALGEHRIH